MPSGYCFNAQIGIQVVVRSRNDLLKLQLVYCWADEFRIRTQKTGFLASRSKADPGVFSKKKKWFLAPPDGRSFSHFIVRL